MEKISFLYKLESHPGKKLIDHIEKVAELSMGIVREKIINFTNIPKTLFEDISYIIGFTHDLGKATSYFQKYLHEKDEDKKKKLKTEEARHSLLSAIFTYTFIKGYLRSKGILEDDYIQYLPLISFMAVKLHHDNPDNFFDEILSIKDKKQILIRQIGTIDKIEMDQILDRCPYSHPDFKSFKSDAANILCVEICKEEKARLRMFFKRSDPVYYLMFQFLYSVLLNADKWDAIGLREKGERISIDSNSVDIFLSQEFTDNKTDKINIIRNNIYEDVIGRVNDIDLSKYIYSLNVPTGTGKTLTSLSFALKLRQRILEEKKFTPRIIYVLPFLSIIDQNYKVFQKVFEVACGKEPSADLLLKHHHLAEIEYRSDRDSEFSVSESQFLIEGWESEVVVTTFMQLFHSLISDRNRMIRKFQNIINSIIILDEVQIIPYKYWELVRQFLVSFSKRFNSYFIFVTATQPLIFNGDEIKELVQNREDYFKKFDRINFVNKTDNVLTIDQFKELLFRDISNYPDESFLVVLNTIDASIKIYEFIITLKESNEISQNTHLCYLSTNIIPKHRLERINSIKKLKNTRKIIISTQMVEAGVDIDVDRVYRDFGPFDSLNQVAGRCNRNYNEAKKGIVAVFILKDDNREYYKYIYGESDLSMSKTKDTLKGCSSLTERAFLGLGAEYFERIKKAKSDNEANQLMQQIASMKFSEFSKQFRLIETDYPSRDLFIELDEKAVEIWKQFIDIRELTDKWNRKSAFLKIKKDFYEHVISVPKKIVRENDFKDTGIVYISSAQIPAVYNENTGYIRKEPAIYLF